MTSPFANWTPYLRPLQDLPQCALREQSLGLRLNPNSESAGYEEMNPCYMPQILLFGFRISAAMDVIPGPKLCRGA